MRAERTAVAGPRPVAVWLVAPFCAVSWANGSDCERPMSRAVRSVCPLPHSLPALACESPFSVAGEAASPKLSPSNLSPLTHTLRSPHRVSFDHSSGNASQQSRITRPNIHCQAVPAHETWLSALRDAHSLEENANTPINPPTSAPCLCHCISPDMDFCMTVLYPIPGHSRRAFPAVSVGSATVAPTADFLNAYRSLSGMRGTQSARPPAHSTSCTHRLLVSNEHITRQPIACPQRISR